jgi:excisionase family DNA binding protein
MDDVVPIEISPIEALTVPEVMACLRLSRSKVYDLIRTHQLPSIKAGRSRRIPAFAIAAYLRQQVDEVA